MKAHQRYFVVRDQEGKLLPNFISVRNGNAEHLDNVVKGNEKVLVARLEDGEFFWNEDQKLKIADLVERLKAVTFHEKIGSLYDHMGRTRAIASLLADKLNLSADEKADLERAASIYKFDLLTGMVGEFDELQGIMGEKYALLAGENATVAAAIREHYMPISADGDLPETKVGAILAIADKLDTVLSFFSVGLIPSGSNDPYALRRATQGIDRIMNAFDITLPFNELLDDIYATNMDTLTYSEEDEVKAFVQARVEKMMDKAIPKDIVTAVLASDNSVISSLLETAQILAEKAKADHYKASVESLARVGNLAEKADASVSVSADLFENEEEKALAAAINALVLTDDISANIDNLFALSPTIDAFFDNTMVMAEDQAVKANRLALLASLTTKTANIAAFNQLNTK
jgi:glycyl-tRNA synthetase beta chain